MVDGEGRIKNLNLLPDNVPVLFLSQDRRKAPVPIFHISLEADFVMV